MRIPLPILPALAAFLPVLALLPAQTVPQLIGITAGAPLLRTRDMGLCTENACPAGIAPMTGHPAAGGTGYDPRRGGAWVTNGNDLALLAPQRCTTLCGPQALLDPSVQMTGLAVDEVRDVLWVSDTRNVIHQYAIACPVQRRLAQCAASVPSGHTIGGLATADAAALVLYATSDFSGTAPPGNRLVVATQARPCQPLCVLQVDRCGTAVMGPIHGVAFDQCTDTVWLTDGYRTVGFTLDVQRCSLVPTHCCGPSSLDPYIGLCILPSQPTAFGRACAAGSCVPCSSAVIGTVGDPALGNGGFAFTLDQAPVGALCWLGISLNGPCSPFGVIALPPFCGRLHVDVLNVAALGAFVTGGGTGCTGSALAPLGVPPNPVFCGLHACAQWVGVCGPSLGTFVTPALSFAVSGT